MKSIKSSRIVKIICFLFCVLFLSGAAANVILGLLLSKSNLFYAEKDQLEKIVYDEIVRHYNDSDVKRYLSETLSVNDDAQYPQRELELYQTKFSREKSNLSFVITDKTGQTVLSNFLVNDKRITFTKTIQIYDYNYPYEGSWTEDYSEDNTTPPETTEGLSSVPPEPTAEHATVPPESAEENGTVPPETTAMTSTEGLTAAETTTAPSAEPTTAAPLPGAALRAGSGEMETQQPGSEHLYLLDETGEDEEDAAPLKFRYIYYGDTYNEDILNYCKQFYSPEHNWCSAYAETSDNWMTFREDDFAVSENGVVYYRWETEPTTYIADISYDFPHTDYTAVYTLPKTFTAKDLFYYAEKLTGFAYGYIRHLALLTVLFALAAALFFILLLVCAGYVKGAETPQAKGLHRIPYDIVCAVAAVTFISVGFFLVDEYNTGGPLMLILGLSVLALILILFLETTVARVKAKTIGKNFFIVWLFRQALRLFRMTRSLVRKASENMSLLWKIGIFFGLSAVAEFIYSLLLCEEEEFIFLWIVVKLLEIPLLLLLAIGWNRLQNGARRLSEGNYTEKVDEKHLFGEFLNNARYLNAIGDGLNQAVGERMKSESMKTELITNVSHDLKTPLTSIINYVDLLKGTDVRDEKALEYIDVIDRQSQRLKKLCADIVDASKAATGNLTVNPERTALNVLVSQAAGEYEERLTQRSLQLILEQPEKDLCINADGRLLWRVFDNLMNNVCKYAMSGTRVYLSLTEQGKNAAVVFRNISVTALNISPEELTERFVRGDASRNTEGSGLGLSIAKSLTELMGGSFEIAIDGDLFKVTLTFPLLA